MDELHKPHTKDRYSPRPPLFLISISDLTAPKATYRFNNSLQGLTELGKAIILIQLITTKTIY